LIVYQSHNKFKL